MPDPIIDDYTAEFAKEHHPPEWDGPPTRIIVHRDNTPNRNATLQGLVRYQTDSGSGSYHYLVRDFKIGRLVDDNRQAWHAKASAVASAKAYPVRDPYGKQRGDVRALGVCLVEQASRREADLAESYPEFDGRLRIGWSAATLETGLTLIKWLQGRYDIPTSRVFGHSEFDPQGRSFDPDKICTPARLRAMLEGQDGESVIEPVRQQLRASEAKLAEAVAEIREALRRLEE